MALDRRSFGLAMGAAALWPGTAWAAEGAEARLTRELTALTARAERLFKIVGIAPGPLGARYKALWQDERWLLSDDAEGHAQAITLMRQSLNRMREITVRHVADVPTYCIDVDVRELTAAEIAAGKGGFREAPTPTTRGFYAVDLRDIRRRPTWTLPSVVAHELLPGHMIQLGQEAGITPDPRATSFVEGWAIYAEALAGEYGGYPTPPDKLGNLHWLIFRLVRALADIGIHQHGWTSDRAAGFMLGQLGEPAYFAPIDVEIARNLKTPGVRAGEALSWLAIADRAPQDPKRRHLWLTQLLAGGRRPQEEWPR